MWLVILAMLLWPENAAARQPSGGWIYDLPPPPADAPAVRIGRHPSGFL